MIGHPSPNSGMNAFVILDVALHGRGNHHTLRKDGASILAQPGRDDIELGIGVFIESRIGSRNNKILFQSQ